MLITFDELADLLRVPKRVASLIARRPSFPAPAINESRRTRLWVRGSVEAWVLEQERRNG